MTFRTDAKKIERTWAIRPLLEMLYPLLLSTFTITKCILINAFGSRINITYSRTEGIFIDEACSVADTRRRAGPGAPFPLALREGPGGGHYLAK